MIEKERVNKITDLVKEKIGKNQYSIKNSNILDWAKKLIPKIPSKQEAEKFLKNISNEEIKKVYNFIDKNNKNEKMSFDLKKIAMILFSLAVLNGGTLPSDASAACSLYECGVQEDTSNIIGYIYIKEVKNLDKAKSFEEAKNILLQHAKTDGKDDMSSKKLFNKNINNVKFYEVDYDSGNKKEVTDLEKLKKLKEVQLE